MNKGKSRPYNNILKRRKNLKKFFKINKIITFNEKTPLKLIKSLRPDVVVKGGDYKSSQVVGYKICKVLIFPYLKGYSSTNIIDRYKLNKKLNIKL